MLFVEFFYDKKKRQQYVFLKNTAFTPETYDEFITYIQTKIKQNKHSTKYHELKKFERHIIILNDIVILLGYQNFGDIERVIDGITLKEFFEKNRPALLKQLSCLLYQLKLEKKDVSSYDFRKFMITFNTVLEELTSGKIINIKNTKDVKYIKYQFNHLFKQKEINIIKVPDAITINFVPFDIVKTTNSCYMLDDDGHAL